jgi:hypothetical protein
LLVSSKKGGAYDIYIIISSISSKVLFAVHAVTQAFGLCLAARTAEDHKSENNL